MNINNDHHDSDGNVGKFKSMIENLTNINQVDENGNSLLHWYVSLNINDRTWFRAAAYKRMEMVKDLIEAKKIDTNIKNKLGKTAWDLVVDASATDMSFFDIKVYLKQKLGK